jgi:hypothetical protein
VDWKVCLKFPRQCLVPSRDSTSNPSSVPFFFPHRATTVHHAYVLTSPQRTRSSFRIIAQACAQCCWKGFLLLALEVHTIFPYIYRRGKRGTRRLNNLFVISQFTSHRAEVMDTGCWSQKAPFYPPTTLPYCFPSGELRSCWDRGSGGLSGSHMPSVLLPPSRTSFLKLWYLGSLLGVCISFLQLLEQMTS